MQLGRYADALKDFDKTIEHDPQAYDAMRGQGKCLSMLGRDFEALSCFNNLRRIYPEDPDIYYEMADILFSAGYMDDCEKVCRRCLQLDDRYANAYVILGMIATRRGEDDMALGLLGQREAAVLAEFRNRQLDVRTVVQRGDADVGGEDRLLHRGQRGLVPRLDYQHTRFGGGDSGDVLEPGRRPVIFLHDAFD